MRNTQLTLLVSVIFVLLYNFAFFNNVIGVYPLSPINLVHILSLAILLASLLVVLLSFVLTKYTTKPVLIVQVLVSSEAAYYIDT